MKIAVILLYNVNRRQFSLPGMEGNSRTCSDVAHSVAK